MPANNRLFYYTDKLVLFYADRREKRIFLLFADNGSFHDFNVSFPAMSDKAFDAFVTEILPPSVDKDEPEGIEKLWAKESVGA